jgi:hypothetical protein
MSFKRCRQRWDWGTNKKWIPKRKRPALMFGSMMHEALAEYYPPGRRRGVVPAKTFKKLYQRQVNMTRGFSIQDADESWHDAGELGVHLCEAYVIKYGDDPNIEVIKPEFTFTYKMRDAGGKWFVYIGRFDALIRFIDTDMFGLFEHKTTTSIKDEHLALDEQGGAYWLFAPLFLRKLGLMRPDEDLEMILYNFLRKALPDPRPQNAKGQYLNKNGSISKRQPKPLFERVPVFRDEHDRRMVWNRIRAEAWEMRLIREGKLPIYKNPTKDCSWDCAFYDACELHETGSDYREFLRQNFDKGDPYADYDEGR